MAFFDFDELEVQVPASDVKREAVKPAAKPGVKVRSTAWAKENDTAKESERTPQIPRTVASVPSVAPVPCKSIDAVEVTLKMYESKDQSLRISSQATVQDLYQQLEPVFGSLRITGAQLGARERFQRREKGWALEGHQALRPSDQLKNLLFKAVLLCRPRVGPVAEIDLRPLQFKEERRSTTQAITAPEPFQANASKEPKIVKEHLKTSQSGRSQSGIFAKKMARRSVMTREADGAKLPEDLLAQALEMELEIDGRLQSQRDCSSQLEVTSGIFTWSTTRVFLVDALNEVLAQMKQAVQGSVLYSKELLNAGCALTLLRDALQDLILEQNEGLREVYWSMARPGGLRDNFRGWASALVRPRGSGNGSSPQAQTMSGFDQVLFHLQRAIHGAAKPAAGKAIAALSEELRNARSPHFSVEQLGPLRLLRTSSTSMTWMLAELRSEYKKKAFQDEYKQMGAKRPLFVLETQSKILPKYGFSGDVKGVFNMKMEVGLLSREDRVIWKLMMDIHKLLDLPDSAATEILTLDFGAANEVEREVTSIYQQALQLSTLEKLIAARLRHKRNFSEGLELLCLRLADPLHPAPVAPRGLAAFGAASREAYVLTGAPRRRFALDILNVASGVIPTRKALDATSKLCLEAHPMVIAKSEALELVERELPRCFQQPEVNAAPLLLRWQQGERDIDATEESGVSALHLAAGDNHGPLLSALLTLNAKRDVRDHLGRTAAHWAAMRAQPSLVLLQRAGFDLKAPDRHGRTPLTMAKMNGMILPE